MQVSRPSCNSCKSLLPYKRVVYSPSNVYIYVYISVVLIEYFWSFFSFVLSSLSLLVTDSWCGNVRPLFRTLSASIAVLLAAESLHRLSNLQAEHLVVLESWWWNCALEDGAPCNQQTWRGYLTSIVFQQTTLTLSRWILCFIKGRAYCRNMLPRVWSSRSILNVAAFGIFSSSVISTLYSFELRI